MRKLTRTDIVIAQYRSNPRGITHTDVALCGAIAFVAVAAIYIYLAYSAIHTVAATFRAFS